MSSQVTTEGIRFKRQLVGDKTCKAITITNMGVIPAGWKLAGALPAALSLSSGEGVIPPGRSSQIVISLCGKEPELLTCQLLLEVWSSGPIPKSCLKNARSSGHAGAGQELDMPHVSVGCTCVPAPGTPIIGRLQQSQVLNTRQTPEADLLQSLATDTAVIAAVLQGADMSAITGSVGCFQIALEGCHPQKVGGCLPATRYSPEALLCGYSSGDRLT